MTCSRCPLTQVRTNGCLCNSFLLYDSKPCPLQCNNTGSIFNRFNNNNFTIESIKEAHLIVWKHLCLCGHSNWHVSYYEALTGMYSTSKCPITYQVVKSPLTDHFCDVSLVFSNDGSANNSVTVVAMNKLFTAYNWTNDNCQISTNISSWRCSGVTQTVKCGEWRRLEGRSGCG